MMYKSKSGAGQKLKALVLVPTLALAVCVVSVPAVRATVSTLRSSEVSPDKGSENMLQNQISVVEASNISDTPDASEVLPQYPGGEGAMFQALANEMRYPEAAEKDGASGRAVIKFVVNTVGEMQDFEVLKSSGYGDLDDEAIRAIKEGLKERWIPGTVDGKPASVSYCIPITFKLK